MNNLSNRELDALVAEKVMGWDCGAMLATNDPEVPTAYTLPHYSTDIRFAFRVVEKMRKLGWSFACTLYEGKLPYASFCKMTAAEAMKHSLNYRTHEMRHYGMLYESDLAQLLVQNPDLRLSRENVAIRGDSSPAKSKQDNAAPEQSEPVQPQAALKAVSFTVLGDCPPKPRQTRSDKWKKRPSVVKYRNWADAARAVCHQAVNRQFVGAWLRQYRRIKIECYFTIPKSWTKVMKERKRGEPHHTKIDCDNLAKSVLDAIFPVDDSHIYELSIRKLWDDGNGARTVITLY